MCTKITADFLVDPLLISSALQPFHVVIATYTHNSDGSLRSAELLVNSYGRPYILALSRPNNSFTDYYQVMRNRKMTSTQGELLSTVIYISYSRPPQNDKGRRDCNACGD